MTRYNFKFLQITILFLAPFFNLCLAQDIRINEVVASNSNVYDEEGDTPDWIELYNYGTETISLNGMTLSDDDEKPNKWTLGDITIEPNQYQIIWASGKDLGVSYFTSLVKKGDDFEYLVPQEAVDPDWILLDFDTEGWATGPSGFGYGDGDDETILSAGTTSVFMRAKFEVTDIDLIDRLYFDIDYDDGFAAYLNGHELVKSNLSSFEFDALADIDREALLYTGNQATRYELNNYDELLVPGTNLLCIQVHNLSSSSTDLSAIAYLTAQTKRRELIGDLPPAELSLDSQITHTNFKLSSEGENLTLYNAEGQIIDRLVTTPLGRNISIGVAEPDGMLRYFKSPTPRQPNNTVSYRGIINGQPEFSHASGFVDRGTEIVISGAEPDDVIRFTLDGSEPTVNSAQFVTGIVIQDNTTLRAKIFREDFISSYEGARTYFVDAEHDIPMLSMIVDPLDFFDEETGIYSYGDSYEPEIPHFGANFWRDFEIPAGFEYFSSDGNLLYDFSAGVKIFGGWSRSQDQRSLSIFARKTYGQSELDYPFFDSREYSEFESVILRNTGNDFLRGNMRDVFMTSLLEGSGLAVQAYQPVATYINGRYWGMYFLREKINEHFLASKYDIDSDDINLLEGSGIAKAGSTNDYIELRTFIKDRDLSIPRNYDLVADRINVENFIIYNIAEIYFGNTDWPGNNRRYWNTNDRKWEYILFDTDFGYSQYNEESYKYNILKFALEPDGPSWPNPPHATLFLRKLLQNEEFKILFVNRYADELNSRFLPDNINQHLGTLTDLLEAEMPQHFSRWGGDIMNWDTHIQRITNYTNLRAPFAKNHILSELDIPHYHTLHLSIDETEYGSIIINNRLLITDSEWNGDYFESIPFKLEAQAMSGYKFSHWSGDLNSAKASILVDMSEEMSIQANFVTEDTAIDMTEAETCIWPNPVIEDFIIEIDLPSGSPYSVKLLDPNGIYIANLREGILPQDKTIYFYDRLPLLETGVYLLEITSDNKIVKTLKFFKS
jgi:hypothetical protein